MKYEIKSLNRIVELDDKLVEFYRQFDEIRDSSFFIFVVSQFGHIPTEEEISTEKLSELCNELLLDDLEMMALLPKAIEIVTKNQEAITNASKNGQKIEFELK